MELIEENGTAHTVYDGGDTTACGAWLEVKVPLTSYRVRKVRVYTKVVGPEAIDAVGLVVPDEERYAYNGFNQLTGVTSASGMATAFGYDGAGNQTTKTETPAGGAAQLTQYVYDQDNRLVGIALPNGGSNAFAYDANGLRTKKTDSSGTTSYLLDGMSIVGQYAPDGARQAWYTQSPARIDEVLNVVNGNGKHWYQADALGSVYALTTAAGDVRARGGYDVFGAAVAEYGAAVGQPFGFTGREHELESGLVFARARYLSPGVGRWDRADPMGFVDGPNRYAYAGMNPARFADPTGMFFDAMASLLGRSAILAEEALAAADGRVVDYSNATAALWSSISPIDVMNFSAGLGDALLPYVGRKLRSFTAAEECIDYESGAYVAGTITGWLVWTLVFGAVTVEMQTARLINLTKGENWITNNLFRWGQQAFRGSNGPVWHFHLGPGTLMNHHLPQQARTWGYHLLALIRRLF